MQPASTPPRPRTIERFAWVFHLGMGVWFLLSAADAVRQYIAGGTPAGTVLGTGMSLATLLIAWLIGGVLLMLVKFATRQR